MKRVGVLALALVLALGVLGVGYAMWDATLTIEGMVLTGEVNAECVTAFTDDDGKPDDPEIDPFDTGGPGPEGFDFWGDASSEDPTESKKIPVRSDKDVGKSTATITEDPLVVTVLIENAYPCYYTSAYFEIMNTGTIPLKVLEVWEHHPDDHWVSYDSGLTWEWQEGCVWYKLPPEVVPCHIKHIDFNGDGIPELNVHTTTLEIGMQIDPGESGWMDYDVHVKQAAAELAEYVFNGRVVLAQWNEFEEPME